ncbi:terminase small subunit [Weissella tructae]|uniref:terminase small subunit n=1 Tax=Weissella tructae TaxID=887702 RepID=UPI003D91689B
MTTKEQAEQDYMAGMKYKDIAAKYEVTINTVKSWKTRGKWVREKGAHKNKKGAHKNEPIEVVQEVVEEPENYEYGLTPKQRKFADEYIKTGNATHSAISAGYSEKTAAVVGGENLRKPYIKKYIDSHLNELSKSTIMGAEEAMKFLTSVVRGEVKETVVIGGKYGLEETEKEADIKTRISATKELLKRHPENDKLTAVQVRKLEAEADIAEAKAKEMAIEQSDIQTEIEFVFDRGGDYEED